MNSEWLLSKDMDTLIIAMVYNLYTRVSFGITIGEKSVEINASKS